MEYTRRTRSLSLNLVLVLPLLVAYELWLMFFRPPVVNMAGSMAKLPMDYLAQILNNFGQSSHLTGTILFNSFAIIILLVALIRTKTKGTFSKSLLVPMLAESCLYGFFLGHVVVGLLNFAQSFQAKREAVSMAPLSKSFEAIMLSIGAGVYEEIVFRLLLVGGLYFIGHLIFARNNWGLPLTLILVVASALSAVKQLSSPVEALTWRNFLIGMLLNVPLFIGVGVLVLCAHCLLIWALKKLALKPEWAVGTVSVIIGSLLFAAFHHVGPLGEPLVLKVFLFRFLAGLLLSSIYQLRGLGIAVYTHGIYDILIVLSG